MAVVQVHFAALKKINLIPCLHFLPGGGTCSSGAGRECWKWKLVWLPNPPSEVCWFIPQHLKSLIYSQLLDLTLRRDAIN